MGSSILSEVDDASILRTGLSTCYWHPLDWLPASRLLPPRSGLERSDFVLWPIAPLPQEYMSAMSRKLTRALHNAALMQRSMWRSRRIRRLRKFRQRLCCLAHTLDDELCGRA